MIKSIYFNILFVGLLFPTLCLAKIIHVPGEYKYIQEALNNASEGDTVQVEPGTYTENIVWPDLNGIQLIGSGQGKTIIDGNKKDTVILIENEQYNKIDNATVLKDITITNGDVLQYNQDAGGIGFYQASPCLINVTISNNSAASGGGMAIYVDSNPRLTNVTIIGNHAEYGGGIDCYYSNPSLTNVTITDNSAEYDGGGIYCEVSNPSLTNVTITDNSAEYDGGGIYCYDSNPSLTNVTITDNSAEVDGGGIYCDVSNPSLTNVTITDNSAEDNGGGIYCTIDSTINFDKKNRCNIYKNNAYRPGDDIFSEAKIHIILNKFTVKKPTPNYIWPVENFSFGEDDIQNGITTQIYSTLYVSLSGNDSNEGTSESKPFKTIQHALSLVDENNDNADTVFIYTLYLDSGTYSEYTNKEKFPLSVPSNVIIKGKGENVTILNADGESNVLWLSEVYNTKIEGLTITNSYDIGIYSKDSSLVLSNLAYYENGGGIYCDSSYLSLTNVKISKNTTEYNGGIIYCIDSNLTLTNSQISKNTTEYNGGGIYCIDSNLTLTNSQISQNTAGNNGGGMYVTNSNLWLSNVKIIENTAQSAGGGLYCDSGSTIDFNKEKRCDIYKNRSLIAYDIYSEANLDIVLDTFTVKKPTSSYAYPLDHFSNFDIQNSIIPQIDSNVYVSPSGSNENEGMSESSPLKTITYALSVIAANEESPYTIFLNAGTYSPGTNGEIFPIKLISYVTIKGKEEETTILNAGGKESVFSLNNVHNSKIDNLIITNGSVSLGGGIYSKNSQFNLSNLTVTGNFANDDGGGIYFKNSEARLYNLTVSDNSADEGGGIYFNNSKSYLSNVTVNNNSAKYLGGGIYCDGDSTIFFNKDNLCNIYTNNALAGNDISSESEINIVVDTFTVKKPTSYYAYPIENFTFDDDIQNSIITQIYSDVYVSPLGNNNNEGKNKSSPLKTIDYALSVIAPNMDTPLIIFLDSGTYSSETNDEKFPLYLLDYVSIKGEGENETILDANGKSRVLFFRNIQHSKIENITITKGLPNFGCGGGVYIKEFSTPIFSNVTISNNSTKPYRGGGGGGVCIEDSNPIFTNVIIINNDSESGFGGGAYIEGSSPIFTNVNINNNTTSGSGGGIYCGSSSSPSFTNIIIDNNFARFGGGIMISDSNPSFTHVTISNNTSRVNGGGIYCDEYKQNLSNVTVTDNTAENDGGGIYCEQSSIKLSNVTISNNSSDRGGGIYCDRNSTIDFSKENRCNIYSNNALFEGNDICSYKKFDIILDTFTVLKPTPYFVTPFNNLENVDIQNSIIEQIDSNIYVSPSGHNENKGTSESSPFKTIRHALSIIASNEDSPYTIFLDSGTYGADTNGEIFPINLIGYLSIKGKGEEDTILKADGKTNIFILYNAHSSKIDSLKITNGSSYRGGGIYCYHSELSLSNLTITGNSADMIGGGIYFTHSKSNLSNVTISNNSAHDEGGGGIYFDYCSESNLSNVKIINNTETKKNGGGIYFNNSESNLSNVTISNNLAHDEGGGLYFKDSTSSLSNVLISNNLATDKGGGIYCDSNSTIDFNEEKLCNIYSNNALLGKDICSFSEINIIVDTFTVKKPTSYYTHPIENFSFNDNDIQNSIFTQINSNVYVSPSGSNENKGIDKLSPLKTIDYALSVIYVSKDNPHTIFLDSGTYSSDTNDEKFPLCIFSYVSIKGEGEQNTILNAKGKSHVLYCKDVQHSKIEDITLTNGHSDQGGGLFISDSNLSFTNVIINNNSATKLGGGVLISNSDPIFISVIINNNSTNLFSGGGIFAIKSKPTFTNVTIANNLSESKGGGIYCNDSELNLSKVTITKNTSNSFGGGIYCYDSELNLSKVTITRNTSNSFGGGIYCDDSRINFDNQNRCNIYLNSANRGNDIYTTNLMLNIILDTFSVKVPTGYYVSPIKNCFSYDIKNQILPQISSDLFVSPSGNNSNQGASENYPLKTIQYALSVCATNNDTSYSIFLDSGIYSPNTNGETYPLYLYDHVTIKGEDQNKTILDANGNNSVLYFHDIDIAKIDGVTIQNGAADYGGGVYCYGATPILSNMTISKNSAIHGGGVYFEYSSSILKYVAIVDNFAKDEGGGIFCYDSSPTLSNVTISRNSAYSDGAINIENDTDDNIPPIIRNSIIWHNSEELYSEFNIYYSNIENSYDENNTSPLFINSYDNFNLQPNSPCIDAGNPDLDGDGITWENDPDDQDPDGSRMDMGAYYFPQYLTFRIPDQISEDHGVLTGTVHSNYILKEAFVVKMSSSNPSLISVPETVVIPAGCTATTLELTIHDNQQYDPVRNVVLSAKFWKNYQHELRVIDDELWITIDNPENNDQLMILFGRASDRFNDISDIQLQISEGNNYINENYEFGRTPAWIDAHLNNEWTLHTYKINWKKDTAHTITARATNVKGYTAIKTITYIKGNLHEPSMITCELSLNHINAGEPFEIKGRIEPPPTRIKTVHQSIMHKESRAIVNLTTEIITNIFGEFTIQVPCGKINKAGLWEIYTSWDGDQHLGAAKSDIQHLNVSSSQSMISIFPTSQHLKLSETVTFTGKLSYHIGCSRDLLNETITLKTIDPSGNENTKEITTYTLDGDYKIKDFAFNQLGEWKVQLAFSGNLGMSPCASETLNIHVVETAGYAIIVQGKIKNSEGLRAHNKTTQFVYKQLKARKFIVDDQTNNDDIMYFNYDIEQSGVDSIPKKDSVRTAITDWAKMKMDQKPANLYIIMVDHGLEDEFYIDPDVIKSTELAEWLNILQEGLQNEDAKKQEIVIILGFCKSGSFIDELSGDHRIIITSASKNEYSYKGPKEVDNLGNILRDGEYFITEFFKKISFGQSIKKSFEKAVQLTEQYTLSPSGSPNSPFFDKSLQHPLIDDNGDKQGSNILSDSKGDGAISDNIYIGVSEETKNDPDDVSIIKVSEPIFLQENETSVKELWARVDRPDRSGIMWVEIKAPDYKTISVEKSGQAEMDLKKVVFDEIYNQNDQYDQYERHEWYNLSGFTTPGTYQVFYFAIDNYTKHTSSLMETIVYKAKTDNRPPCPFQLISPENVIDKASTTATSLILRWNHADDPEEDFVTYTVVLSENNWNFHNIIQKNSIINNACIFNRKHGIKNFTRYYWKVIAIDQYGARQESDVWTFYTDDKTNPIDGALEAYVYNQLNGQLVKDASVIVGNLPNAKKTSKGYYLDFIPPGIYNITIKAPGYFDKNYPDIKIPRMETLVTNFRIIPEGEKGDLNADGKINIQDVIFGLKVLAFREDVTAYVHVDMGIVLYVFQEVLK